MAAKAGTPAPTPPRRKGRGLRRRFRDLRVSRKLMVVIAVHLLHAVILLVVTAYGMKALSASRAYVEGEGLWSKAQKEGTLELVALADGDGVEHYDAFLRAIDVTLGDRQARLEMDKGNPDMAVVRDGFLRGKNHPDDVKDLVWLYRNFHDEPHLAKAIAGWALADVEIQTLMATGERLRDAVVANDTAAIPPLRAEVYASDARLTVLEDNFSRDLGNGVRWLTGVVTLAAIGLTVVFVALALVISTAAARQITGSLRQLDATARAVSAGDLDRRTGLDGGDEVATVGRSLDALTARVQAMLQESREAEHLKANAAAQAREIRRLGELDAFRAEFINTASHELRTPLTPLRTQLRVLRLRREAAGYGPEEQRSLAIAERNVERLTTLVEDMLQVSSYQVGRMTVKPVEADVHALVSEAAETFQAAAKDRGIRLEVASTGPAHAVLDPARVSQVLYNLLGNAVKFTGDGGWVRVASETLPSGVVLRVQDNGIGIRHDDLVRLFQPFSQVHSERIAQPGSGLGLYICRAIVELHGGSITAESAGLGKGTTIRAWIPAPPGPPGAAVPA